MFEGKADIEKALVALSEQLEALDAGIIEMVVCGGAALNVLGYVRRTTKDVDVVALVEKNGKSTSLVKAGPFSPLIRQAADKVRRDFNLPENWLNPGPASVMDFGLPKALMERTETRYYGNVLIIHYLGRYDQIHFKLHAAVDQGGKHFDDLLALKPSSQELEDAARWSMTHDRSEGFRLVLKDFLQKIGHGNVAAKI
ncbi:MAG: DUF6036 family nucleotidyltransferase [Clostridiales bacterium]|nr:DUF6036 family nucleotidyltransferase [Clostridiales bacterium]